MASALEKDLIIERITPIAEDMGLELLDVESENRHGRSILRLIVDCRGGVTLDQLEELSEVADPIIELELKINHYHSFEVSSPGFDRPLTSEADFIRYEGEIVKVKLYAAVDGKKTFVGPLIFNDDEVGILQNGEEILFPLEQIANIKREVVF